MRALLKAGLSGTGLYGVGFREHIPTMKQKVSDYIDDNYIGRKPDPRTIIARIQRNELAGCKEGGIWYVDLSPAPASTGNARADKMLREMGCL